MIWNFQGKPFLQQDVNDYYGFVYLIKCLSGEYSGYIYVGKKNFFSVTNPKISKRRSNALYSGRGRKPSREQKRVPSNWINYHSSSGKLQELIETLGEDAFEFTILRLCRNNTELSYYEARFQMELRVFFIPSFNDWITIKINRRNMPKYSTIQAYGLTTRVWTDHPDYGYGCAECCNGDRCDEDCDAVYKGRRKECPHCKGQGWIPHTEATNYLKN